MPIGGIGNAITANNIASAAPNGQSFADRLDPRLLALVPGDVKEIIKHLPAEQAEQMLMQAIGQALIEKMMPPEMKARLDATSDPAERNEIFDEFLRGTVDRETLASINDARLSDGQATFMKIQLLAQTYLDKLDRFQSIINKPLDGLQPADPLKPSFARAPSFEPVPNDTKVVSGAAAFELQNENVRVRG